ncbi:alkaline phosphatase family protein [Sphingomonas sp.]|uniref:alkaline phosphatase family protein n=1 Tax=Sphingomonas sp. TaxID=28214 RepID=UPI00325FD9BE
MRKTLTGLLGATLLATPAFAAPPKLVIAISVDQFSSDLFDEYRPAFTGGLARLSSGAAFRNGYQGHAASETCPGHSTILTGDRPARTGIIANNWVDQSQTRSDKGVYCAEDERVAGSSTSHYTVSPLHLRVPTLGERLKQVSPASRSVAVAGKDRAAVMMSGQRPDQRWYWDGKRYTTDLVGVRAPAVVAATNAAVAKLLAAPADPLEAPPLCVAKSKSVAIEGGGMPVGAGAFARAAGDARSFRASPQFDGATLALAAGLIQEMKLGKGEATDLIAIGASATDYVGHSYGTEGQEMCLNLLSLDRDLGDFFAVLDRQGLDYAVVLTADHGGNDVPERQQAAGIHDAARVDPALFPAQVGKAVAAELGLKGPVLIGDSPFGDIYLDRALAPADRKRALTAAVALYQAHPQVEAAFTHDQLRRAKLSTGSPDAWSMIERARSSFDDQRSGDLVVLLRRRVTPIADTKSYVATHGSPWDYDRRVPILFWRAGMPAVASEAAIETIAIAPTLAAWIGVPIERGAIDGSCLMSVPGVTCPAR